MSKVKDGIYMPEYDQVLLLKEEPKEITSGGIIIPESSRNKTSKLATIIAFGPDVTEELRHIGRKVAYNRSSGVEIVNDGVTYLEVKEDDIFFVLN